MLLIKNLFPELIVNISFVLSLFAVCTHSVMLSAVINIVESGIVWYFFCCWRDFSSRIFNRETKLNFSDLLNEFHIPPMEVLQPKGYDLI